MQCLIIMRMKTNLMNSLRSSQMRVINLKSKKESNNEQK